MAKPNDKCDPYWLDPKAQAARAGKSWLTLCRWMDDPTMRYPKPERYFRKTPVTRIDTIRAWEDAQPTEPTFRGIQRRQSEDRAEPS